MEKIKSISTIISLAILIVLSGCMKEDIKLKDPSEYNRPLNFAAPIFNAHLSATDLLNQLGDSDIIYTDDDGLIHAKMDTSFEIVYDDIIIFDDLELTVTHSIPTSKKSTQAEISFIDTVPATNEDGQRFDKLTMETAYMDLDITVPLYFTGPYTISFPEIITPDGKALKVEGDLKDGDKSETIDLSGSELTFIQAVIDGVSRSSFTMVTTINGAPTSGDPFFTNVRIDFKLHNYKPGEIWGYFGRKEVNNIDTTLNIDLLSSFNFADAIQFKEINIELETVNKFGVPLSIITDSIVFENTTTGEKVRMKDDEKQIHIEAAKYNDTEIEPVIGSTSYDFSDAVNIAPDKVYFKMGRWINWDGDETNSNFLVNNGKTDLYTNFKIDIPFWFQTTAFERTDTISFDVRGMFDDESINYLKEMKILFTFDNGFPFDINAQANVVDSAGTIIGNLFDGENQVIWESPEIDSEGKAEGTVKTVVPIIIDSDQIKEYYNKSATEIWLVSSVKTGSDASGEPTFVKLFDYYTIDISMSIDIKSNETAVK